MIDRRKTWSLLIACVWLCAATPARGQVARSLDQLEGVGVTEHLDRQLPLGLSFRDDNDKQVHLQDYFAGKKPVLLSLNYSSCPMLCSLQLNGLVDALEQLELDPGQDFEIVSVSIDPLESPLRARQAKQRFLQRYGRTGTGQGWHFLTGNQREIKQLADAVGFEYRYVPERKEYAHAAVCYICTPEGRISRYLYGVQFDPQTVRLSLVEAAAGKIGTTLDRVLLFCFHYDAAAGNYAPTAVSIMKLGGGFTVVCLLGVLLPVWLRRRTVDKSNSASHSSDQA